jgi:hypothetical protein
MACNLFSEVEWRISSSSFGVRSGAVEECTACASAFSASACNDVERRETRIEPVPPGRPSSTSDAMFTAIVDH